MFDEAFAQKFDFDVLDSTKLIPEEILPLRIIGRMVLDRNVDNYFAETEQVAFCVRDVVPGIDFTNDPLLQGRILSYVDTQLTRLGGPNYKQIPVNAAQAPWLPGAEHAARWSHDNSCRRSRPRLVLAQFA